MWTKDDPLKVGFHPPEQCARGRTDCRSLAQVVSTDGERTFICCGEVAPAASPEPQDRWAFCVVGDRSREHCAGTDIRIFVDRRDMAHAAAVLSMGVAMAAPADGDEALGELDGGERPMMVVMPDREEQLNEDAAELAAFTPAVLTETDGGRR